MLKNVSSKIFYAFLTQLGVVSLIFFLFNVLPGDPAQMMLGQNENSDQLGDPYFKRVYNIFNNNGVGLQDDELYGGYGSGVSLAYNGEGNIPDTFKVMKNIYRMTQSNNNPAPVVFEYDASRPNTIILRSNSTLPNLEIPTTYTWEVTGWFKQQDNDFNTIYTAEGNNGGAFILQSDSADSVIAVPTGVQNPYQAITSDSTDGSGLILSLASNSISIGIKLTVQKATGIGVQSTSTIFLPGIISNRDFCRVGFKMWNKKTKLWNNRIVGIRLFL